MRLLLITSQHRRPYLASGRFILPAGETHFELAASSPAPGAEPRVKLQRWVRRER